MAKGTYLFKDKDPIIDVMRTLVQMWAEIEGVSFSHACTLLAEEANVSRSMLYNWFEGATRFPQYRMVAKLAEAMQYNVAVGQRTVVLSRYARRRAA